MKKFLLLALLLSFFCIENSFSQAGEWVWLHGDSTSHHLGNYGVQGIPSPTNNPPTVYEPCEWTDLNGNFWLFGGGDSAYVFSDLWKYDPLSNEWTWVKGPGIPNDVGNYGVQGIPSSTNNPSMRAFGVASWTDNQGNLWMFGGCNYNPPNYFGDLWKYNIQTNEWTWMNGANTPSPAIFGIRGVPDPANRPQFRFECAAAWTDSTGDLWMFGGWNGANTLWRYQVLINEWTWMKGDTLSGFGVNGSLGIEDSLNTPGYRYAHTRWKDKSGMFWLFGGAGGGSNDLWRYNWTTNNWTWMNGSNTIPVNSTYGTRCIPTPFNEPGHRYETRATWTDKDGNLWMFGGAEDSPLYQYNDLWKYCINLNQWIWISGDGFLNGGGRWGTRGVSSPLNKPSQRQGSVAWTDNNGHLYLFGGSRAYDYCYNDLWKFTIDTTCGKCQSLPSALFNSIYQICPGACIDFTNLASNATSFQWSFPGATPSASTDVNPTNICYSTSGSYDVQLIATNANGSDTLLLTNYITVYSSPPPQSIAQSGDSLFANAGAVSYQWYFNSSIISTATDYFYVALSSGDYNVVATDSNGCEVEAAIFNVIANTPSTPRSLTGDSRQLTVYPNPADEFVVVSSELAVTAGEISIYNMLGEMVLAVQPAASSQKLPERTNVQSEGEAIVNVSTLTPGMYYLELIAGEKSFRAKFVKH